MLSRFENDYFHFYGNLVTNLLPVFILFVSFYTFQFSPSNSSDPLNNMLNLDCEIDRRENYNDYHMTLK